MTDLLIGGTITAAAFLLVILRFGRLKRVLAFATPIDMLLMLIVPALFAGTFTGMMIAMVAGLLVSITLTLLRRLAGHDVLTRNGWRTRPGIITAWKRARATVRARRQGDPCHG